MSAEIFKLRFCRICKGWVGTLDGSKSYCDNCESGMLNLPPVTHYEPDDLIDLVKPVAITTKVKRQKIEGINVPVQGETLDELNAFRARYDLAPVGRKGKR